MNSRLAQISVNEQDPLAGLGDGNSQIAGQRGLAVAAVGAGDLNDLVPLLAAAEVQGRADPAEGLGLDRFGAVMGAQHRIGDVAAGQGLPQFLGGGFERRNMSHHGQAQTSADLVHAVEAHVLQFGQIGQPKAGDDPQDQADREDQHAVGRYFPGDVGGAMVFAS